MRGAVGGAYDKFRVIGDGELKRADRARKRLSSGPGQDRTNIPGRNVAQWRDPVRVSGAAATVTSWTIGNRTPPAFAYAPTCTMTIEGVPVLLSCVAVCINGKWFDARS
jgi:hypothetical protein